MLALMDEAVAGLRAGTNLLLAELPDGNLTKAAKNTGRKNAVKLIDAMDSLEGVAGEDVTSTTMRDLGEQMVVRSDAVLEAIGLSNGDNALDAVRPELTVSIETQAPIVRAAALDTEPPPPPAGGDTNAQINAEVEKLLADQNVYLAARQAELSKPITDMPSALLELDRLAVEFNAEVRQGLNDIQELTGN